MRGLLRDWLGTWEEEEIRRAEELGVRNPQPFTADQYLTNFFMFIPDDIGQAHKYSKEYVVAEDAGLHKLPGSLILYRNRPESAPPGEKISRVRMSVDFTYEVSQSSVKLGCCGKYSLRKAVLLANKYGADPRCGGGIKRLFPPRKLRREAERKLDELLESGEFSGLTKLVEINEYAADCFYNGSRDNFCNIRIYVGNEISIMRELFRNSDAARYNGFRFTDHAFRKFETWRSGQSETGPVDCLSAETLGVKVARIKVRIKD